jgi:hypothetical protein
VSLKQTETFPGSILDSTRTAIREPGRPPGGGFSTLRPLTLHSPDGQNAWALLKISSVIFVLSERSYRDSGTTTPWVSRGTDPEENDKRPLGSFGRVASRMNCRYRAPVPFTPLVATVLLASPSIWFAVRSEQPRIRPFCRIRPAGTNG